jgi:GNAT superfamily N-acetyltransferase
MSTSSWQRKITLQDGARVTLRPITPADKPLLAASFERLSEESRYRRFFTPMTNLSAAQLDYLVDIDHHDHEAIVAVDPISGEGLAVARYLRANENAEAAEVAVTVADDWQGRGLGRALLDRLNLSRPAGGRAPVHRASAERQSGVPRAARRCWRRDASI